MRDGRLEIVVTDSGCGLRPGAAHRHGVGLSTTRERRHALYGGQAALTLEAAAPRGTVARLLLPLSLEPA